MQKPQHLKMLVFISKPLISAHVALRGAVMSTYPSWLALWPKRFSKKDFHFINFTQADYSLRIFAVSILGELI